MLTCIKGRAHFVILIQICGCVLTIGGASITASPSPSPSSRRQYPINQECGCTQRWDYAGLNTEVLQAGRHYMQRVSCANDTLDMPIPLDSKTGDVPTSALMTVAGMATLNMALMLGKVRRNWPTGPSRQTKCWFSIGRFKMFFKQLATRDATLSYFFGCAGQGAAVAVDVVAGDENWFVEEAAKAGVQIRYVIDTHVHADHYSGGRELARRTDAPYCLHEVNFARAHFDFEALHDNQLLDVGNVKIRVLHTPGHTADSICLLVTDARRGSAPWFAITGDTLFVGAVGRPDLAGRELEMAGQLYDSLHTRLLSLPDELEIFPGHQAGSVCGAGLSGKPSSTVGFEKRWNAALVLERSAFIAQVTASIPPPPADMERIVMANLAA